MTYKPIATTIGGGTREFSDDEIRGKRLTHRGDSSDFDPLPERARVNLKTWDGLSMRVSKPEMTDDQEALARLLGMTVILDSNVPDGEMVVRVSSQEVRLINIGKDTE